MSKLYIICEYKGPCYNSWYSLNIVGSCSSYVEENMLITETLEGLKYSCGVCGHQGSRKDDTKRHIITLHIQSEDTLHETCSVCCKTYKNMWSLRTHMHRVHGMTLNKKNM